MAAQKIEELTKDLNELALIEGQLKRPRNIDAVSLQKKRVESEISKLRAELQTQPASPNKVAHAASGSEPKRYECEIINYAWDQSDKFVKLFIALDGVQDTGEDNVVVTFTPNSILLKVANVQSKDHKFEVNNLLHEIDVASSYRKVKTNAVAIYAKKVAGKNWSHLTQTEKRLADLKKSTMEDDLDTSKDDPGTGLMKIMQKMYESGDSETKRMISKAWAEGQEKQMTNPDLQF